MITVKYSNHHLIIIIVIHFVDIFDGWIVIVIEIRINCLSIIHRITIILMILTKITSSHFSDGPHIKTKIGIGKIIVLSFISLKKINLENRNAIYYTIWSPRISNNKGL